MSTPGQSLRDSITNLGAAMKAAKATSEEIKGRVAERETTPVQIGQEVGGERDSGEPGTP